MIYYQAVNICFSIPLVIETPLNTINLTCPPQLSSDDIASMELKISLSGGTSPRIDWTQIFNGTLKGQILSIIAKFLFFL